MDIISIIDEFYDIKTTGQKRKLEIKVSALKANVWRYVEEDRLLLELFIAKLEKLLETEI